MKIKGFVFIVLVASIFILTGCPGGCSEPKEYGGFVVTTDATSYWLYDCVQEAFFGEKQPFSGYMNYLIRTPDSWKKKRTSKGKEEYYSVKITRESGRDTIYTCVNWELAWIHTYRHSSALKNRKDVSVLLPEEHAKKIYFNRQCEIVREETEK